MKNSAIFGSTGENIVFVGDSAGGNLVTACTIKCIELGVKIPKGLLNIYSVFMADYVVTPARFLSLVDVGLNYQTCMKIFPAYLGHIRKSAPITENRKVPKQIDKIFNELPKNYLMSPQLAPDEILKDFPVNKIVTTNLDPCLDDCVEFAKRLKNANTDVHLDVLEGICHGFLNVSQVT